MDYKKIYDNLIFKAKNRDFLNEYYEIHHITPKCLGGDNSEENLVKLTLREHYFAHELLTEIYPSSKELSCSLWIMTITTIGSFEKAKDGTYDKRKNRSYHFLEKNSKEIRISANEYEYAKKKYRDSKIGKIYTKEERENVSIGTKLSMRNKDIIDKCISGSKGCHYYHSKIDGKTYKWFPGDEEIDLSIYEWGRSKMSDEQKKKISESNKLSKRYFIIPEVNSKYALYEDFVNELPNNWEEKWTNESNRQMKRYITLAVRQFNIDTNFEYEGKIIFKVPGKSKNFKIITPSLYICCSDVIKDWRKKDITNELVEKIKKEINKIIELNNIYMKI